MLNSKQRAYLRSLANSLDTILMVGKGGLSDQIYKSADEAITETILEIAEKITEAIANEINADVVQVIGTKFVLYRKNEDEPVIVLPKSKK